jgi:hypothetical protein
VVQCVSVTWWMDRSGLLGYARRLKAASSRQLFPTPQTRPHTLVLDRGSRTQTARTRIALRMAALDGAGGGGGGGCCCCCCCWLLLALVQRRQVRYRSLARTICLLGELGPGLLLPHACCWWSLVHRGRPINNRLRG